MTTPSSMPRLRTFLAFAIMVATACILARGFTIWTLRSDAIGDASRDVGHVAALLAEQTEQSIKAIVDSLAGLQQQLIARQEASPDNFPAALHSAEMQEALGERLARLPQAAAFAIAGPDGRIVNHSASWPA